MELEKEIIAILKNNWDKYWKNAVQKQDLTSKRLAKRISLIVQSTASGEISRDEAQEEINLVRGQMQVAMIVQLMMAEGAAQNAINDIISTITKAVNLKIGFDLI